MNKTDEQKLDEIVNKIHRDKGSYLYELIRTFDRYQYGFWKLYNFLCGNGYVEIGQNEFISLTDKGNYMITSGGFAMFTKKNNQESNEGNELVNNFPEKQSGLTITSFIVSVISGIFGNLVYAGLSKIPFTQIPIFLYSNYLISIIVFFACATVVIVFYKMSKAIKSAIK